MAALPPKLMCRAKGVVGAVLGPPNMASSSSMAFSLIESELVDMLPRRMKEEVSVGEVPESPMVVIDKRRLCASALPLPLPLGKGGPADAFEGPREKRLDKAAWVIELRRWPVPGPLGEVSDMALAGGADSRVKL